MDEQTWKDFNSLPAEARRQVADFIAFLRKRYQAPARSKQPSVDWEDEPFVGMWKDRDDMADSTAWVRRVRKEEWTRRHG
jgi:hypothetical protein